MFSNRRASARVKIMVAWGMERAGANFKPD